MLRVWKNKYSKFLQLSLFLSIFTIINFGIMPVNHQGTSCNPVLSCQSDNNSKAKINIYGHIREYCSNNFLNGVNISLLDQNNDLITQVYSNNGFYNLSTYQQVQQWRMMISKTGFGTIYSLISLYNSQEKNFYLNNLSIYGFQFLNITKASDGSKGTVGPSFELKLDNCGAIIPDLTLRVKVFGPYDGFEGWIDQNIYLGNIGYQLSIIKISIPYTIFRLKANPMPSDPNYYGYFAMNKGSYMLSSLYFWNNEYSREIILPDLPFSVSYGLNEHPLFIAHFRDDSFISNLEKGNFLDEVDSHPFIESWTTNNTNTTFKDLYGNDFISLPLQWTINKSDINYLLDTQIGFEATKQLNLTNEWVTTHQISLNNHGFDAIFGSTNFLDNIQQAIGGLSDTQNKAVIMDGWCIGYCQYYSRDQMVRLALHEMIHWFYPNHTPYNGYIMTPDTILSGWKMYYLTNDSLWLHVLGDASDIPYFSQFVS